MFVIHGSVFIKLGEAIAADKHQFLKEHIEGGGIWGNN